MNLITTPWLPIVKENGVKETISLGELFQQSRDIRDLAVNPPQRIALMRFLLCIVQAALDGPADEKEWSKCKDDIPPRVNIYLKKWQATFHLRGKMPFFQIKDLSVKKGNEKDAIKGLGALDFRSPLGGSSTPLFDHVSIDPNLDIPDEKTIINLLTLQNFSTGGKVGQAMWNEKQYSHATFAAPCIKALHTFITGKNILATLHWNLMCKTGLIGGVDNLPNGQWGRPVWEKFPESDQDAAGFKNAHETYLGRLVPLARLVNLTAYPGKCIMGPLPSSYKLTHLPEFREPSTTISVNKKNEPYYFAVSSKKHMWRELGGILAQATSSTSVQSALAIKRVRHYSSTFPDERVDIWVGGLETGASAAKLSDMLEWNFSLPLSLCDQSILSVYETGVKLSQTGEYHLKNAVKEWFKDMKVDVSKKKNLDAGALNYYWSQLDNCHRVLIDTVTQEKSLNEKWYGLVRKAMESAFFHACSHTTPRQIRAFARAKKQLWLKKTEA